LSCFAQLFDNTALDDCHEDNGSGRSKAVAAAEALRTIAADVESEPIVLSIPMPGHTESRESVEESVEAMDKLVRECDAVFLLTDTRESRWLPTVMAAAHDKLLINAALGLDSWLVMRHGGGCSTTPVRYGCYFCNDVVAPENSTKNRTLDQQCTVTRPGLAPIASSMAVEMMVSLLHHPDFLAAPAPAALTNNFAPTVSASDSAGSPLGVIPHQIRGSLVSYTMMTPTVPAFKHCTGCSAPIVEAYRKDKIELVLNTCQTTDGSYLEAISGLTGFRAEAAEKFGDFDDWDEDEED
jgi:ubiquitin-like modifier-activating enzyme ATG7